MIKKKNQILINCFVIILLWFAPGYFFYSIFSYLDIRCKPIFNFELLFGASITLGVLNGITSCAIFEFLKIGNKRNDKFLILLFFVFYLISMFAIIFLDLSWLYYTFSIFSIIGFASIYHEFNPQSKL